MHFLMLLSQPTSINDNAVLYCGGILMYLAKLKSSATQSNADVGAALRYFIDVIEVCSQLTLRKVVLDNLAEDLMQSVKGLKKQSWALLRKEEILPMDSTFSLCPY